METDQERQVTRPVARPEAVELSELRRERTCESVGVGKSRPLDEVESVCPSLLGERSNTPRVPLYSAKRSASVPLRNRKEGTHSSHPTATSPIFSFTPKELPALPLSNSNSCSTIPSSPSSVLGGKKHFPSHPHFSLSSSFRNSAFSSISTSSTTGVSGEILGRGGRAAREADEGPQWTR